MGSVNCMKTTIIINSETLGRGDEELGKTLMGSFLRKLMILEDKPNSIIFYNSAVKLLTKELHVLDALHSLFEAGVDLIACGTCVGFYDLEDKLEVGRISNMEEIIRELGKSDKVITP